MAGNRKPEIRCFPNIKNNHLISAAVWQPLLLHFDIILMKKIAMIPARYAATRFPAKLMQQLGNKTVIRHTYDNTLATGLFDDVIVVTDSDIIYNEITKST